MSFVISPKNYNLLVVASAASIYQTYFSENGATKLNCMIQERSEFSSSDAFGLIADAIEEGLIYVQKSDLRRLVVNDTIYKEWRDRYTDEIASIQAAIVSSKWPLRSYRRDLSAYELEILHKNIGKGRLYELVIRRG